MICFIFRKRFYVVVSSSTVPVSSKDSDPVFTCRIRTSWCKKQTGFAFLMEL